MDFNIPYAKEKIRLSIPDKNILYFLKDEINILCKDESKIIKDALKNPIGSGKLSELCKGSKNACILVSDITRPCPTYKFLPAIVEELNRGGIANKDIKIVFGLGIHRHHTEDEKKKLVGNFIYENIETADSDCNDVKLVGHTSFGTPVEVYCGVLNCDLLIATGNIEYHYFAGYSGGAKAVMPGMCSRNSIQANHSMMLDDGAAIGKFYNNPVRQDIEEAGRLVGIDFIFNAIVDDDKNIIDAVAGENNAAYLEGIKKYDKIYKKEVEFPADIVITSQGGYPKDLNLYQSHKALENVKELIKKDGTIILIASCAEGFGEDVFCRWMADVKDFNIISQKIKKNFVLGGHKAAAISKIMTKASVLLYSDFNEDETSRMGFKKINDLQNYLDKRISENNDLKITVVPTGRYVGLKKQ